MTILHVQNSRKGRNGILAPPPLPHMPHFPKVPGCRVGSTSQPHHGHAPWRQGAGERIQAHTGVVAGVTLLSAPLSARVHHVPEVVGHGEIGVTPRLLLSTAMGGKGVRGLGIQGAFRRQHRAASRWRRAVPGASSRRAPSRTPSCRRRQTM